MWRPGPSAPTSRRATQRPARSYSSRLAGSALGSVNHARDVRAERPRSLPEPKPPRAELPCPFCGKRHGLTACPAEHDESEPFKRSDELEVF